MTRFFNEKEIKEGAAIIKNGGTVAFRTETVYGLGADATNAEAVTKIFLAKGRPATNPLIVHFASLKHLVEFFPDIDPVSLSVLRKIKRAITVILPRPDTIAEVVSAGYKTVAVRVPACSFTRRFIKACGVPLAAPSANLSGRPSPTRAVDVSADIANRIDAVFMGADAEIGVESTVVRCETKNAECKIKVLRLGGVSTEMLAQKMRLPVEIAGASEDAASPGRAFQHYMPRCPMYVALSSSNCPFSKAPVFVRINTFAREKNAAVLCLSKSEPLYVATKIFPLGNNGAQVTKNLFTAMRKAEKDADVIICEQFPPTPEFDAANERIMRASDGKVL